MAAICCLFSARHVQASIKAAEESELPEEEQRRRRAGRENGNKIFNKSRGRLNTKLGIPDPAS